MRVDLTKIQVAAIVTMLDDAGESDDVVLRADMLEAETDLYVIATRILDAIEAEEGNIEALKEQASVRAARKKAAEHRLGTYRTMLTGLMETARLEKLVLPEATVSLREVAPKRIVTNPDALPDEFCTLIRKPDLAAIKAAESMPDGVAMDNGGQSITIRRK